MNRLKDVVDAQHCASCYNDLLETAQMQGARVGLVIDVQMMRATAYHAARLAYAEACGDSDVSWTWVTP